MGEGEERAYLILGYIVVFGVLMALDLGIVVSAVLSLGAMFPVAVFIEYVVKSGRDRDEKREKFGPRPKGRNRGYLGITPEEMERQNAAELRKRDELKGRHPFTWTRGVRDGQERASRLMDAGEYPEFQRDDMEKLLAFTKKAKQETNAAEQAWKAGMRDEDDESVETYHKAFYYGFSSGAQGRPVE